MLLLRTIDDNSGDGQTAGLVIGCIIAVSLMITSLVLLIREFCKPDPVYPASGKQMTNNSSIHLDIIMTV